jgi:hypothetical protein
MSIPYTKTDYSEVAMHVHTAVAVARLSTSIVHASTMLLLLMFDVVDSSVLIIIIMCYVCAFEPVICHQMVSHVLLDRSTSSN